MQQTNSLQELALCVERHNETVRQARALWSEAEQASQKIGRLVGLAVSMGTSWAELGRVLARLDEMPAPTGLKAPGPESAPSPLHTDKAHEEHHLPAAEPATAREASRVPQQGTADGSPGQRPEQKPPTQSRALQIVRGVCWPSGIGVDTLRRTLAAEGHTVTEPQTRSWFDQWIRSGDVQQIGADRYLGSTVGRTPLLLQRAHQVVALTPDKEMSTRELAAALNENVQIVGGELCSMLREVGITRPNRGKIRARYGGTTGPRLPGYKAETLARAIALYDARATSPQPSGPAATPAADPVQADAERAQAPPAQAPAAHTSQTACERALHIVREAGATGITHVALVRQLDDEKHTVVAPQVRAWLREWVRQGVVNQLQDGAHAMPHHPEPPSAAAPTEDDSVPRVLVRAREATHEAGGKISSQELFTALQRETPVYRDASDVAGQLVALLNRVGVKRPDRGKVRVRLGQPQVLGFTATTLEQGINAYRKAAADRLSAAAKRH
ncbi:hypothetical protein OG217_37275 (plasmid) [Streptomyces sp. NBC_01023]|uniref:hypothetical protein n=1 Tax=unclassified Streptomyces TaxID=2593676 RepID=UPI002F918A33|nr:hypothetical protein OG217_37275 [Streptomyces sp. NBC_01023]